jgi:hypothetical protein
MEVLDILNYLIKKPPEPAAGRLPLEFLYDALGFYGWYSHRSLSQPAFPVESFMARPILISTSVLELIQHPTVDRS